MEEILARDKRSSGVAAHVEEPVKRVPEAPVSPKPPGAPPPRIELPRSFSQMLTWLDPRDYRYAEAVLCHMPFIKDLIAACRVVDTVVGQAQRAEYRAGEDRIKGSEMDAFREELEQGLQMILNACVYLARRAGTLDKLGNNNERTLKRHRITIGKAASPAPPQARTAGGADPKANAA